MMRFRGDGALQEAVEAIKNGATEIDLNFNNIGHEGASALANALVNNESLQTLDLWDNNIGHEGATALTNALANNESLQSLNLCENDIGDEGARALANALANNESLRTLELQSNKIGDEGATALANALVKNESLQTLVFRSNKIGDEGATALANALVNNESLQTLDLNWNRIGHNGATALLKALANNESLQTLHLDSNNIGRKGAITLANALANNESLQTLHLSNNWICDTNATALANALVNNESLQTLSLWKNQIGDEGARALANALANNKSLRELDLHYNEIGHEGATALANALVKNESLQTLILWKNKIGDEGARALANALVNNKSLQTLSLQKNKIGHEGASALANALANNESLHTLSLDSNKIGDEGATALANALVKNKSLHTLRLGSNEIGHEGATALANALANNESLRTLHLSGNKIGHEGATALANALANNKSLHTLDLENNYIGDEGTAALANALAENKTLQTLDITFNYQHSAALRAALERNRTLYKQSRTPLMQACKDGDISEAEKLVVGGTRIDARDTLGQTTLLYVSKAKDENNALIVAKLLFKYSAGLSSESLGIRKAIANASFEKHRKLSAFLSFIHSLPLAQLQTNALREMVVKLYEQGIQTLKKIRSLNSAQLENLGIASLQDRRALLQVFVGPEQASKLKSLAAELSNARAKRSEEKSGLPHPMLREFFAEQLSCENSVAGFDLQQADVSEKEKALTTLQKTVKADPEKIPERNQMRRDLVASIRETLAKSSQIKLRELEDDANNVVDTCRRFWRDTLGESANIDDAATLLTLRKVQKATRTMIEAIKAWEARHDTIAARERTTAALNALEESTKRLGIQPTFFKTLTYPERSQELLLELQDVYQAFVAELNVLSKGDPMADAPLNKLRRALSCIFSLYTCTIPNMVSRVTDLERLLSCLTPGLTEPNTEDAELLLKNLRNKTRKRKRLAFELDDAREDANAGDEESQARIADLEQELAQIGSVDKFDSELHNKRARLLRHAEEHYPELLHDQEWLKRLGLGDDGAPLELSKLGLWRTTARREHFVTLKELASKPGKSVEKVRGPDGLDLVLKTFHLASEAWSSRFHHQVAALAQIQSAYIVQIQGAFMQNACKGCILMPFYSGGDLATWIRDHSHADMAMRLRIAIGLLSGLHDLHSRGFVHCNVKPENIFLAKGPSPVLGDFDDVQTHNVPMTQPMQTTIKYMAPELRNGDVDTVEPAVDMFSVGVVLAELFDGSEVSDAIQALVSSLQSADPTQRPTALEALHHEAFQAEPMKKASCAICLDIYPVSKGVSCADGHFTCRECLGKSVRAAAQPQAHGNVRRDGSMCCVAPDCKLLVSGRAIASAVPDEDFAALLDIVRAHFEQDAAAEQERQFRDRVDAALREHELDRTTQNHIRAIQDEVLAMSCPRCSTVFADFDGCCALKCGACSCYFCAWCLQDTGNDSDACHQHVATCASKPAGEKDPFFSDFAVVKQAWTRLRVQRLRRYMAEKIEDAGIRALVQQRLRPLLTPDIAGDDFTFEQ